MVARFLGVEEVVGSNPVVPTISDPKAIQLVLDGFFCTYFVKCVSGLEYCAIIVNKSVEEMMF